MIEDDIDEALHALEFGPTITDGQGKVARARHALKALREQAREANALRAEVSRLGRQCDDLTAGFVEKQAEITSLRAEVARHADDLRMVIEQREAMRGEVEVLRFSRDKLEDALRDAMVAVERLQATAALADEIACWLRDEPRPDHPGRRYRHPLASHWLARYDSATREKTDAV